jgi:hypothetical protein
MRGLGFRVIYAFQGCPLRLCVRVVGLGLCVDCGVGFRVYLWVRV